MYGIYFDLGVLGAVGPFVVFLGVFEDLGESEFDLLGRGALFVGDVFVCVDFQQTGM